MCIQFFFFKKRHVFCLQKNNENVYDDGEFGKKKFDCSIYNHRRTASVCANWLSLNLLVWSKWVKRSCDCDIAFKRESCIPRLFHRAIALSGPILPPCPYPFHRQIDLQGSKAGAHSEHHLFFVYKALQGKHNDFSPTKGERGKEKESEI